MLGLLMLLSFAVPLSGALAIRRYTWLGVCAALTALVAIPVIYKVTTNSMDPMGWGFVMVLVFMPALAGVTVGAAITAFRRWRGGPGPLNAFNVILGLAMAALAAGFGLLVASDF